MRFVPTEIPDVVVIEPDVHRDGRGYFLETWSAAKYRGAGIPGPFVQDNRSRSARGTLRGLHAQRTNPQGKLVQVVTGEVFDVAVDLRAGSPTYGRWVGVSLSADSFRQMWVPPGFAHGFCVTSDWADVEYKCTAPYDPADEIRIAWDDPDLAVAWPTGAPVLSAKDAKARRLTDLGFPAPRR